MLGLSDDEKSLLIEQKSTLVRLRPYMQRQSGFFDGSIHVKSLGISVPDSFSHLGVAVGWPKIVASVPAERVRWRSWVDEAGLRLDEIARDTMLAYEFSQTGLESGVFGQGYIDVAPGDELGPDVSVRALSAKVTTGIWDEAKRRLGAGYTCWFEDGSAFERLYTADRTVTLRDNEIVESWEHGFGRPTLVRLANGLSPSEPNGQSDIDAFIRYYTENAARSILGMEVSREFYVNPQRYAIGLEAEDFGIDPDAPPGLRKMQGWNAAASSLLVAPFGDEGEKPVLGQFTAEGPSKYWETVRYLAQMVATHAGLPESYVGFSNENPTSADAIRAHENRLVQKCKARQDLGNWASREIALLCLLTRDGTVDADAFRRVTTQWEDVETPTRASAADAAQKLVASNILPADSQVTRDMVGLSPQHQKMLESERQAAMARTVIDLVQDRDASLVAEPSGEPSESNPELDRVKMLSLQFEALGRAIRATVDPDAAAEAIGLQGIRFTGGTPAGITFPDEGE